MEMMKAIACSGYGSPDVMHMVSVEKPVPDEDEVLVKVHATSVTNSDIFIRSSKVNLRLLIPFRLMIGIRRQRNSIIGQVYAGEVEKAGKSVKTLKEGDRVYGLTGFSLGGYAEYKKAREESSKNGCLSLMPGNVTYEEATSAAYGGLLALQQIEKKRIFRGERVLLYGASGTSGIFALQYLKYMGAEVTCVCRENKFDFMRSLGGEKFLDYTKDESIGKLEMYDLFFDCVGKNRQSKLRKACRSHITDRKGFISIDDGPLELSSERLLRVGDLVKRGIVTPINDRVYSLDKMAEAHRYVELGHKKGNVAVTIYHDTRS